MSKLKDWGTGIVNAIRGLDNVPTAGQPDTHQRPEPPVIQPGARSAPVNQSSQLGTTVRELTDPGTIRQMLEAALYGDHESAHRVYVTMELTWDRLVKNMHELRRSASKAEFVFEAYRDGENEPTPAAIEKAELVKRCVSNWIGDPTKEFNSFESFLYDLTDAAGKGVSVQELIWDYVDGEWRPVGSIWCDPTYWGKDPQGVEIGLRNVPVARTWAPFPEDKFIVGVFKNKSGPWPGYGLFRSIAWWWSVGIFARQWLARYAELFGVPYRVVKTHPDASNAEKQSLLTDLEAMGDTGCLVIPDGADFVVNEASKSAGDSPQVKILEMRDKMVDILILGQTLTTDVGESGSRAVAEVHATVKTERKVEVSDWVATVVSTQLIPAIIRKNYGNTDELPVMTLDLGESGDPVEMANRDVLLNQILDLPKSWLQKRHRIPDAEEGEELIPRSAGGNDGQGDDFNPLFGKQGRVVKARGADKLDDSDELLNTVIQDMTGISEEFLGPIKPVFGRLIGLAQRGDVSDEEFTEAVEKLIKEAPELFDQMDRISLKEELEKAMGAAAVNGAYDRQHAAPGSAQAFID